MTRQTILRSQKKEDAAEKDLNDPGDDMTINKLDKGTEEGDLKENKGSKEKATEKNQERIKAS